MFKLTDMTRRESGAVLLVVIISHFFVTAESFLTHPEGNISSLETLSETGFKASEHICDQEKSPCTHGYCKENGRDYTCSCHAGYSGRNCSDIEWCYKYSTSVCDKVDCKFNEYTNTGYCDCGNNGTLFFDVLTHTCKPIDTCSLMKLMGWCNKTYEICEDGKCNCEKNYRYSDDKASCIADFCLTSTRRNPCGPHSTCYEGGDGTYQCLCHDGYTWNGRMCKLLNRCSPGISNCEQKCNQDNGVCSCYEGFTLQNDNKTCKLDDGKEPCDINCGAGKCFGNKCLCPEITHISYTDTTCIDRCQANQVLKGTCPEGVVCKSNARYGFICKCNGTYKLAKDGIHCERKNMCTEGGGKQTCAKKNAECRVDPGSSNQYKCQCRDGYAKEGKDEVCTHKCLLKEKVKECVSILGVCELDANYNAVCKCRPLMDNESGKCEKLAKYSFTGNFFVQRRSYEIVPTGSGKVKRSINSIDYIKLKDDFKKSLESIYTSDYKEINILNCGYADQDLNCSVELQLKNNATGKLKMITSPSVCLNIEGNSDHCLILPNLIVKKTPEEVFRDTDPCNEDVRNKVCGSATHCTHGDGKNFTCTCARGFKSIGFYHPTTDKRTLIEICEDINECSNSSACPNTTECFNTHGSYECPCKNGFRKTEDAADTKTTGCIAVCAPNPCEHGTCHQTGQHGFACNCEGSYTGIICNETNTDVTGAKEEGHRVASIVGGVLGAVLVVALIVGFVIFRKKQKKSEEDSDDYTRGRRLGILTNMGRSGRKEQTKGRDIEIQSSNPLERRGSGDYRREYRESELAIPRPQVGGRALPEKRESGDYRRGYAGDDRMFPKAHTSRHSDEESRQRQAKDPQSNRRPLSRSTDQLNGEERRKSSVMQYRNKGFEED